MKRIINLKQASVSASNRGESIALEHMKDAVMLISVVKLTTVGMN